VSVRVDGWVARRVVTPVVSRVVALVTHRGAARVGWLSVSLSLALSVRLTGSLSPALSACRWVLR
jgi:hypothetical protein